MLKMFSKTAFFFSLSFLVQHVFLPSKWNTLLSAHLSFWILPPVVNRNLRIDKESTQNVFKGRASFYSKLWTVIDRWVLIWTKDIPITTTFRLLFNGDRCSVTKFKNTQLPQTYAVGEKISSKNDLNYLFYRLKI